MSYRPTAPARRPPSGIIGLDPAWSRLVQVPGMDSKGRTWHLLDTWAHRDAHAVPELTVLCVHGNPSWSFLWRHLLARIERTEGDRVRALAIDQLDMGFSERTGQKRSLATRVDDLCHLTEQLELSGPVVTVAHDWGGPISLGWVLRQRIAHRHSHDADHGSGSTKDAPMLDPAATVDVKTSVVPSVDIAGVVLTNTAVHQPPGASAPALIRLVRSPLLLRAGTVHTTAFIKGAIQMSRPGLPAAVRDGFLAPYRTAAQRTAIADFVADIPLESKHESAAALDGIAAGLAQLTNVPALLLWGPRDKVFGDRYRHDLEQRLPHAQVHRFPNAAHFVTEDADVDGAVVSWLNHCVLNTQAPDADAKRHRVAAPAAPPDRATEAIASRRALADFSHVASDTPAVFETSPTRRSISFGELSARIEALAAGMAAFGIRTGDRVAVLITPGIDLSLTVYGCWRLGATLVLVDSGLGRNGMQNALRSAYPDWLIGIDKALLAATVLRWPGRRIAVGPRSGLMSRALSITCDLEALIRLGMQAGSQEESSRVTQPASIDYPDTAFVPYPYPYPGPDTVAAIAFTSGSTGPSKGVIYRHHQIQAQRDALMALYDITPADRLVAAFAPFALYGPTMGIPSMVPAMDVTAPRTLSAQALFDAIETIDATLVFASPAALVNVVATGSTLTSTRHLVGKRVRLVLSAGAPVRAPLLKQASALFPQAAFRTPYGMTEVLPVADISLVELESIASNDQIARPVDSDRHQSAEEMDILEGSEAGGESDGVSDAPRTVVSDGVCVGHPLPEVDVMIDPLDHLGAPLGTLTASPDVLGEIMMRTAHARQGYDRLWLTEHRASQPAGWHRSGDIGQLDALGRLWVSGRLGHVITTPAGPLAPVASEQRIEALDEIAMAAIVGVGPIGTQAVVAVVQTTDAGQKPVTASLVLTDQVRQAATAAVDIAAVLVVRELPVDRRHNSKIDRTAIAVWASQVLSGDRATRL